MILSCSLTICRDPSLGKIDKESLSQQTLMELLIENITNKKKIMGIENPTDISSWRHIKFNESCEVVEIDWSSCQLEGFFNLHWLPPSVQTFNIRLNSCTGSFDLTGLPYGLETLSISENGHTGEISLTELPSSLKCLDAAYNAFFGSLNLTRLPESMVSLLLYNNRFCGSLDFTQLPCKLRNLDLRGNLLEGEGDFRHLPESLMYLNLEDTDISGEVVKKGVRLFWGGSKLKFVSA